VFQDLLIDPSQIQEIVEGSIYGGSVVGAIFPAFIYCLHGTAVAGGHLSCFSA
jgi:hypothetical protein